jgi:hypothetical protein
MQKISTSAELREAIALLELKQKDQEIRLKEQFYATYESFKTINLFKKVLVEVATSPGLLSGMVNTILDLAQRKKHKHHKEEVSESVSGSVLLTMLKSGLMKLMVDNSDTLLLFGQYFIKRLFHHKGKKDKRDD